MDTSVNEICSKSHCYNTHLINVSMVTSAFKMLNVRIREIDYNNNLHQMTDYMAKLNINKVNNHKSNIIYKSCQGNM